MTTPMVFNNIMVDLETTGTEGGHNAIIQLAAVKFNLEERKVDLNMFDMCMTVPGNRWWCEDTRAWWEQQEPHILQDIKSRMQEPMNVLAAFYRWTQEGLDGDQAILWAKPTHFEYPFLQSYFKQFGLPIPFHYAEANDLRTWLRARGMQNLDREVEFEGDAHNALHDVLHQIKVLFHCMEKTNVQIV